MVLSSAAKGREPPSKPRREPGFVSHLYWGENPSAGNGFGRISNWICVLRRSLSLLIDQMHLSIWLYFYLFSFLSSFILPQSLLSDADSI